MSEISYIDFKIYKKLTGNVPGGVHCEILINNILPSNAVLFHIKKPRHIHSDEASSASCGTRTRDLLIKSQMLYQLS